MPETIFYVAKQTKKEQNIDIKLTIEWTNVNVKTQDAQNVYVPISIPTRKSGERENEKKSTAVNQMSHGKREVHK